MQLFKGNERGLPNEATYVELDGGAVLLSVLQEHDTNTRETLVFSCILSHLWASLRFTDSFHPQEPNCPQCGKMWTHVVDTVPSSR